MLGVVGNVGRTALMQVGRQYGRQAVQRLMQGERLEDVLTRDEIRRLGKDLGKVAFNELVRQGKEFVIDDHAKKNKDWNDRMNDFTRNLNEHFRQHMQKKEM